MILRAPATFDIGDAFHMRLREGRMRAIVPPRAQGFTVATAGVDYEDLGTEFALMVERSGISQLHVLDGRVDAKDPGSQVVISSFTHGQSVRISHGIPHAIERPDLDQFPTPGAIGFLRWQQQRMEFGKGDPDLIAYGRMSVL